MSRSHWSQLVLVVGAVLVIGGVASRAQSRTLTGDEMHALVGGETWPHACCFSPQNCAGDPGECDENWNNDGGMPNAEYCHTQKQKVEVFRGEGIQNQDCQFNFSLPAEFTCTKAETSHDCKRVYACWWNFFMNKCQASTNPSVVFPVPDSCNDTCPGN